MNNAKQKDYTRINLILELVSFFEKHNIDYLLGGGTACQLLKNGGIYTPLNENHDVDFHVWEEQQSHFLLKVKELENSGFEIKEYDYKVQLSKPNASLIVEILFLFREGDNVYFRTTDPANDGKRSCAANCFKRQSLVINNKTIDVVSQKYCECVTTHSPDIEIIVRGCSRELKEFQTSRLRSKNKMHIRSVSSFVSVYIETMLKGMRQIIS